MKKLWLLIILLLFFVQPVLAGPKSTNYELQQYQFGGGDTDTTTGSTNFGLFGSLGEVDQNKLGSTNFQSENGLIYTLQSGIPPAPSLSNPSSYYNKLKLIINYPISYSPIPTDLLFAVAVSTDDFVTTKYVQADNTLGVSPVWQSYVTWAGATGFNIIGLTPSTAYKAKVAAKQGKFTQTGFGPKTAPVATAGTQLTFTLSPNSVNIGTLTPATVVTAGTQVNVSLTTNAATGGIVYLYGTNAGLKSNAKTYTINSVTNDLTGVAEGYGVRGTTASAPMEILSPYNGSGNNVGLIDTNKRVIFDSSGGPVTGGTASFELKAKSSATTPAATDYADTLTVIATGSF